MKSLRNLWTQAASTPILADDVLEFHAMRILLLFKICGTAGRIDGLTKMAKLDFFVRYPSFFDEVCRHLGVEGKPAAANKHVESSMIRFHYGPWDQRYYHVLSYLESKRLIAVQQHGKAYCFKLTSSGETVSDNAEKNAVYDELVTHMKRVKKILGKKTPVSGRAKPASGGQLKTGQCGAGCRVAV